MIKRVLMYLAVVAFTLYCFFIYDQSIISFLFLFEGSYFIVAMVQLFVNSRTMTVEMNRTLPISEKGKKVVIGLNVKSRIKFGMGQYKIFLTVKNSLNGIGERHAIKGVLMGSDKKREQIEIVLKGCGSYDIKVSNFYVYDMLGIFRVRVRVNAHNTIGILPELNRIPIEISRKTREFITDADEYSDKESGDDPSELYQIREYREGDSIHKIHWKISAKEDEIMVKENGKPLGATVLIKINLEETRQKSGRIFAKSDELRKNKIVAEDVLELIAAISFSLLDEECVHMVSWYENESGTVIKRKISSEEHLYELLNRMLYIKSHRKSERVQVEYEAAFAGEHYSTVVEVDISGNVVVNGEEVDIKTDNGKVLFDELFMVV